MKQFKFIFFLALIASSQICLATVLKEAEAIPDVKLESSKSESTLNASQARYVFTFRNIGKSESPILIQYSIDKANYQAELNEKSELIINTTPGSHKFQFYYNFDYEEVYTGYLKILPQHQDNYGIYLENAAIQSITEKPIIYLYPETDTTVIVKLDVKGDLIFTYPDYKDGWEFKASPNGDLTFGDNTYNYLFWESSQRYQMDVDDMSTGFLVNGDDATAFLQKTLTKAGLTSKERTDFITYWAPRLAQNKINFVHFEFNDACNRFAELGINPEPDNLYRIYMLWFPSTSTSPVTPQEIETVTRDGFTVIEWGGQELPAALDHVLTN